MSHPITRRKINLLRNASTIEVEYGKEARKQYIDMVGTGRVLKVSQFLNRKKRNLYSHNQLIELVKDAYLAGKKGVKLEKWLETKKI